MNNGNIITINNIQISSLNCKSYYDKNDKTDKNDDNDNHNNDNTNDDINDNHNNGIIMKI